MFPAPLFVAFLIVTTPVILVFDGPIIHGFVIAAAAVSVAIVAIRIRPGEADFLLSSVIRPIAIVALIPALWMVVQVLPLNPFGLANSVWDSAAAALGRPLVGSISIDPGTTLVSLARYLSATAIAFVTAAVAVDRHRAEWILFALTAATTIISLMVLVARLDAFTFLSGIASGSAANAGTDCAALGVNLAAATALHTFERAKMRGMDQSRSAVRFRLTFWACFVAVAVCAVAVLVNSASQTYFAVICGVTILAVTFSMRRLNLGPWGFSAIVSVASVVAIAVIAVKLGSQTAGFTLAFADHAAAPLIAVTHHVLTETSWTGTGAGTFAAVLPIYRDVDELAAGVIPPTAAAAIAVEIGRPFLWGVLVAATALVITLLRDALRRGRDSFYATAGATCVVVATFLAFGNAGLLSTPVLIITASVVGIAVAQRKSRSI